MAKWQCKYVLTNKCRCLLGAHWSLPDLIGGRHHDAVDLVSPQARQESLASAHKPVQPPPSSDVPVAYVVPSDDSVTMDGRHLLPGDVDCAGGDGHCSEIGYRS